MLTIESLGIGKEELIARVVDKIAESVMVEKVRGYDPETGWEGDEDHNTPFADKLHKLVCKKVDSTIDAIAQKHILPNVSEYIENLSLQKTNEWGEKVGKPCTFIEYLVQRAEFYLNEKVNYEGKPQGDNGGYNWRGEQTRITYLVHQHLHYSIDTAMKEALKVANGHIVTGIAETCKLKLASIAESLKVQVSTS